MRLLLTALLGLTIALPAFAQSIITNIPTAGQYYSAGGTNPSSTQGVEQVGIDSVTNLRCMVGETTTCQVPTQGSGGGGGGAITMASGAVASGAYSSGSITAGALAAGAMVDFGTGGTPATNTLLWDLTNASAPLIAAINGPIPGCVIGTSCAIIGFVAQDLSNPTSTLTLPATTTAYSSGQLIANSATAGSVVVPHFTIANTASAAGVIIPRLRLTTNDTTSTAWGGVLIVADLWTAAPTFTNGDRGTYLPATGTATHLGAFDCTMSTEFGDGAYSECSPEVGNYAFITGLTSGNIYWTLHTGAASGITGASKVFTLTPEIMN